MATPAFRGVLLLIPAQSSCLVTPFLERHADGRNLQWGGNVAASDGAGDTVLTQKISMILFLLLLERIIHGYWTKPGPQRERPLRTGLVPSQDLHALVMLAVRKEEDLQESFP